MSGGREDGERKQDQPAVHPAWEGIVPMATRRTRVGERRWPTAAAVLFTGVLRVVTWLGSTAVIVPLGVIVGGFFVLRRRRWRFWPPP